MKSYDNKNIVIIGAGQLQEPAIKIANELGLKTIVTDYNENAPGMKIADYPIVISIRDIDGTVRVLKEFNNILSCFFYFSRATFINGANLMAAYFEGKLSVLINSSAPALIIRSSAFLINVKCDAATNMRPTSMVNKA